MIESRRDFDSINSFDLDKDGGQLRIMLMLTDDFDNFDVEREVVYDSLNDQGDKTIDQSIKEMSEGDAILNTCLKDRFLELICMIIPDD